VPNVCMNIAQEDEEEQTDREKPRAGAENRQNQWTADTDLDPLGKLTEANGKSE